MLRSALPLSWVQVRGRHGALSSFTPPVCACSLRGYSQNEVTEEEEKPSREDDNIENMVKRNIVTQEKIFPWPKIFIEALLLIAY